MGSSGIVLALLLKCETSSSVSRHLASEHYQTDAGTSSILVTEQSLYVSRSRGLFPTPPRVVCAPGQSFSGKSLAPRLDEAN